MDTLIISFLASTFVYGIYLLALEINEYKSLRSDLEDLKKKNHD